MHALEIMPIPGYNIGPIGISIMVSISMHTYLVTFYFLVHHRLSPMVGRRNYLFGLNHHLNTFEID